LAFKRTTVAILSSMTIPDHEPRQHILLCQVVLIPAALSCAGIVALLLYYSLFGQQSASLNSASAASTSAATNRLALISLRSFAPRSGQALARKHLTISAAAAMAPEKLRPVKQVVQGQKLMEGD
jgi:hypothetical protein